MKATALALLVVTGALAVPTRADAQRPPPPSEQDIADIAKCLVAENLTGSDWGAILDVLTTRARRGGFTVARMARAYCSVHRSRNPTARQLRIRALPSPDSPPGILTAYERALVAARRGGPGRCRAEHWGGADGPDFARATRLGWTRVSCGSTSNAFWTPPRRGPSPG